MASVVTATRSEPAPDRAAQAPVVVGLEERTWLPRHCRGDAAAFPALLQAFRRPVYGYLVRAGVAEADRDDLFQSIFLKVHQAADRYEPARPLAPWLFTIAANTVRNHFRDSRPEEAAPADPPDTADPAPDPERAAAARQAVARLETALAALPLAQREVLLLNGVAGLKLQEVAEALSLPLNTVKTHLRRARLTLAKSMAPFPQAPQPDEDPSDDHL